MVPNKQPLGLTFPLRNGQNGFFEQSFDTFTQIKQNIINLLNTKRGERRFNPKFGTRLYETTFEQNNNSVEIYKNIISEDILNWIPEVSIQNIVIKPLEIQSPNDNYSVYISVAFVVNITQQAGSIDFTLNNTKI